MPEPHEEMMVVYDSLRANDREKINRAEERERWQESNPLGSDQDYKKYLNTEGIKLRADLFNTWQASRDRSLDEDGFASDVFRMDVEKLGLNDHKLFSDGESLKVYLTLNDRFGGLTFTDYDPENVYKFDLESSTAFGVLLKEAKAGAQRNATELGLELGTAIALAGDEVERMRRGAPRNLRTAWEGSELLRSLQELKNTLTEWNALLAKGALPAEKALGDQAKKCGDALSRCASAHQTLMTSGGEAPPFVKYQLLATMRAIGEKVAAQYAARAGKASFTALYDLIRDVPNRGPADETVRKAKALADDYGNDLAKAWASEMNKLEKNLQKRAGKPIIDKLYEGLTTNSLKDLFAEWRISLKKPDQLKNGLQAARKTIAEIAFGLKERKEIVDTVLAKPDSDAVEAIRKRYLQTFDGFAQQLHQDILLCVKTLQ
ncbi:MAG TPA: hypothetical protein VIE89_06370 [Candidatus Binatia bacterium]|jgi:hypothetical protein